MQVSVYLLFDGQCAAAFAFYQQIFGGELSLITVGDSPLRDAFAPALQTRVLNARLQAAGLDLSASDWLHPVEQPQRGNLQCLYISGGNAADTAALFERLSQGATVTDPLSAQPFGLYGALNDAFGVRWMFHAVTAAQSG
jgi:PhnB protein